MTPQEKITQAKARKSRREEKRAENAVLTAYIVNPDAGVRYHGTKSNQDSQGREGTPYFVVGDQEGYSLTKEGRRAFKSAKPKKPRRPRKIKRGTLKSQIVRLLGLLDRKRNGPMCRFHLDHEGDTSCHIVPQSRGDAARFEPDNVYWGCRAANYGEFRHRSLYRQYHIDLFGKDTVERLEEIAKGFRQYTHKELLCLREEIKLKILN